MSDLPAGFLRAEARWLEEPDDDRDLDEAYENYCQSQYEYWRDIEITGGDE